jgi:hypothetical protein
MYRIYAVCMCSWPDSMAPLGVRCHVAFVKGLGGACAHLCWCFVKVILCVNCVA